MTVTIETRRDLSLEAYCRVAWQGEGVRIGPAAQERIRTSRESFLALLNSDPNIVVYGVTSGYGFRAKTQLSPEDRKLHARRPPAAPAASFGEPLPQRVVRGFVFSRLTNFVEGHAAVTPELATAVAEMLNGESLPAVPGLGNGCPGEIQALSYLFSDLAQGFDLGEKEALALINGSPCAGALAADAAIRARRLFDLAVQVFALSIDALKAPMEAYDPALDDLWEDPFEADVLRSLRQLSHSGDGPRRSYQAPVSWRILPRVLGQAARSIAQAEEVAQVSLRAVSDNPLYIPPDADHPLGRVFSTGGYHNGKAYPALDSLAANWADLSLLCDRHVSKLLDGKSSELPDQLQVSEDGYLGCLGFTAAAYAEQARHAAQRTFLPGSEGGGFSQNDVAVPTFLAWRKEQEAGDCLESALACLAAVASQALAVTDRSGPKALAGLLEEIRSAFPPVDSLRPPATGSRCRTSRRWSPDGFVEQRRAHPAQHVCSRRANAARRAAHPNPNRRELPMIRLLVSTSLLATGLLAQSMPGLGTTTGYSVVASNGATAELNGLDSGTRIERGFMIRAEAGQISDPASASCSTRVVRLASRELGTGVEVAELGRAFGPDSRAGSTALEPGVRPATARLSAHGLTAVWMANPDSTGILSISWESSARGLGGASASVDVDRDGSPEFEARTTDSPMERRIRVRVGQDGRVQINLSTAGRIVNNDTSVAGAYRGVLRVYFRQFVDPAPECTFTEFGPNCGVTLTGELDPTSRTPVAALSLSGGTPGAFALLFAGQRIRPVPLPMSRCGLLIDGFVPAIVRVDRAGEATARLPLSLTRPLTFDAQFVTVAIDAANGLAVEASNGLNVACQ